MTCSALLSQGRSRSFRRPPDRRGTKLKGIATTYNRGHHRLAVILACWTFFLIIAGALVTSNDAGLSVPDWPTSFGSWYKIPKLVGGVKFEHTHRMIAQVAGLLTVILAVWTWRTEKRRWMRFLGVAAVGTVIAQGVLGGLTVLFFLPPPISSAHAALAQTLRWRWHYSPAGNGWKSSLAWNSTSGARVCSP